MEGYLVEVEADVANGLPSFDVVGLPDAGVREARERVRAAVRNAGFEFPRRRLTVNLAPAGRRKQGAWFDLPIALSILAATGQLEGSLDGDVAVGELSLDGSLRPVAGVLGVALAARQAGRGVLVVPTLNAAEAGLAGLKCFGAGSLRAVVDWLRTGKAGTRVPPAPLETDVLVPDLAEVQGQALAKRTLEVAAAGGHNLLMVGPPGSGKTMLARRLPGILPPMRLEEALEVSLIHSVAGTRPPGSGLAGARPFRAPHHTASFAALTGGRGGRPGEVSLAHHGVLFLDELPEFRRDVLEALREPLEEGRLTVARADGRYLYPSRCQLVASCNPCHCGYQGLPGHECRCTPQQLQHYRSRLSGPLLDRLDLQVAVPRLAYREVAESAPAEASAVVRARVLAARERQLSRAGKPNAQLTHAELRSGCRLDRETRTLVERAYQAYRLSARGHDRLLRTARTIADLAGEAEVQAVHVAEAARYRSTWGAVSEIPARAGE